MPITIVGRPLRTSRTSWIGRSHAARRELGQEDGDQYADGQGDRGRDRNEQRRADDRVRDPAAGPAEQVRRLREEVPVERRRTAGGNGDHDDRQHGDRDQRGERRRSTPSIAVHDAPTPQPTGWTKRDPGVATASASSAQRIEATDDHLRGEIGQQTEHEQDHRQVHQRRGSRDSSQRPGSSPRSCWPACRRCRRSTARDLSSTADHLRHGDRLADRAPEPEDDRGGDPRARSRQDDAANHLPACRAESERPLLELARHAGGRARGRCSR